MESHDDDFDSVSWRNDPSSDLSRPTTAGTDADADESGQPRRDVNGKRRMSVAEDESQAGQLADAVDLAGIGDGVLECSVDSPLKENDGTKDAYISYLVTTHVCSLFSRPIRHILFCSWFTNKTRKTIDRFQDFSKIRLHSPSALP